MQRPGEFPDQDPKDKDAIIDKEIARMEKAWAAAAKNRLVLARVSKLRWSVFYVVTTEFHAGEVWRASHRFGPATKEACHKYLCDCLNGIIDPKQES